MPNDSLSLNIKVQHQNKYDAIVIGSGISGGWAAKELTEKGLKVLMLERGRNVEHVKDYKTASLDPWDHPHRGVTTLEEKAAYPVVGRGWAIGHPDLSFWANEKDCPYTEEKALYVVAQLSNGWPLYSVGPTIATDGVILILKPMQKMVLL